jgi:peroxiredoxin
MLAASLALSIAGCGESPPKPETVVAKKPATPDEVAQPAATPHEPKPTAAPDVASQTLSSNAERKDDTAVRPASFQNSGGGVPTVLVTNRHAALCKVKVGDAMPEISLPQVSGGSAKLSAMYGKGATVVVFWKGDRFMALEELGDLGPDVVQPFGSRDVNVVGIAVDQDAATARDVVKKTAANYPQLLDADGQAFAKVGAEKLPWTLVLDPSGKIVWFDLEYSHTTRRELQQVLQTLVK